MSKDFQIWTRICFLERQSKFQPKSTIGAVNKGIKNRKKIAFNHGHNIVRLFVTLSNFSFTASQTTSDY